MEVSGPFHAQAALPLGKEILIAITYKKLSMAG
jgi:hypothetical protein